MYYFVKQLKMPLNIQFHIKPILNIYISIEHRKPRQGYLSLTYISFQAEKKSSKNRFYLIKWETFKLFTADQGTVICPYIH